MTQEGKREKISLIYWILIFQQEILEIILRNFKKMENLGWENLVKIQGLSKLAIL